jgi:multimeric flavodoxin WrbA
MTTTNNKTFNALTILGSPHDGKSNTRALVDDFVEEVAAAGLPLEHRVISLGRASVLPCQGCWRCTREKSCPQSKKDDLEEIKAAMLSCDLLILASPVYTNQVSAQMKALFDRLFTWCHVFPLLGKYSLSACTTGNDGQKETGEFLEKMLATYGTSSFGTISSMGGFTPGLFPRRAMARAKNAKMARKVARTMLEGKRLPTSSIQRRMFKTMKRKVSGAHTIDWMLNGPIEGQPAPSRFLVRFLRKRFEKVGLTEEKQDRIAGLISFELSWWRSRGWLDARSFDELRDRPIPGGFDARQRLLAAGRPLADAAAVA